MIQQVFHPLRVLTVVLALCTLAPLARAQSFKVATVDMKYLISNYYRYVDAQKEKEMGVEEIREGDRERLQNLKALSEELEQMKMEITDESLSISKRTEIRERAMEKQKDMVALERERKIFVNKRDQELIQKMETLLDDITKSVRAEVQAYAATQDVDFVFDETGNSLTEVPFLIYVRNRNDLTEAVLKRLNKDAPEGFEPPATTSSPAEATPTEGQ